MNKRVLILCFFVALCAAESSAQQKFWVKFRDKSGTPYSLQAPSAFLTPASIQRRTRYGIALDQSDLPVNPAYVHSIDTVNYVRILFVSKWLNGVVIAIDSGLKVSQALGSINSFNFVTSSGRTMKYRYDLSDPPVTEIGGKKTAASPNGYVPTLYSYGNSHGQITQLNVNCLHEKGYRGQGMVIGVMDAGFSNVNTGSVFDSLRASGRILGTRDFADGGTNVYHGSTHGTNVLSCMAALSPGFAIGSAPLASYWLFRTEQGGESISEEYNWVRAVEFADSVGVDMVTTSLGYTTFDNGMNDHTYATLNGRTAPMSIASTMAARKGILVVNAAGNEGNSSWRYISVPADADSICAVAAVDTLGNYAPFSSVGPTADGRIKPDLAATGNNALICNGDNCGYGSGTSFAAPILAGSMACFWQAHREFRNIQVLDTLKKYGSLAANPNNERGWGVTDVCKAPIVSPPPKNQPFSFFAFASGSDNIVVDLSNTTFESLDVEVSDLLGRILFRSSADPATEIMNISLAHATTGIYLVKVNSSAGTRVVKVAKN